MLFSSHHEDVITCSAVHPNLSIVATGSGGTKPKLVAWDAGTCSAISTMEGFFQGDIVCAAFSSSGRYIAAADVSNNVAVFDWESSHGPRAKLEPMAYFRGEVTQREEGNGARHGLSSSRINDIVFEDETGTLPGTVDFVTCADNSVVFWTAVFGRNRLRCQNGRISKGLDIDKGQKNLAAITIEPNTITGTDGGMILGGSYS